VKGFIVVPTISGRDTALNLDQVVGFRDVGIHVECETVSQQSFVIVQRLDDLRRQLPAGERWLLNHEGDVLLNVDHIIAVQPRKEGGTWLYLTKRWLDVQFLEDTFESVQQSLMSC
jgi:hypothetical protein